MLRLMRLVRPKPETAIKIIAALWFLQGLNAAFGIGAALVNHVVNFDFTVLALWLGHALWRHRPRAWHIAVALTWLTIAVLAIGGAALAAFFSTRLPGKFFGQPFGFISAGPIIVAVIALLLLSVWELWTLQRQDVRSLFNAVTTETDPVAV
jgi:hypothetical protein